jgi:tyrosyl-tRNA synthetase
MSGEDLIRLCARYRLARMLEREDFRNRLEQNLPISVHELIYPLLTAYDSVALQSDVELGATEQKFNLLVHREIQREYGQPSQVVMTMPILVGLDGQRKMSKSLGNYVGITEAPGAMFGKLMSISDVLMWSYFELLSDRPAPELAALRARVDSGALHPMDAKMGLAQQIVADYHGAEAAKDAADEFQRVFRDRQAPAEAPVRKIRVGPPQRLAVLLVQLELATSRSEAERLIKQGGVEVDGVRVSDIKKELDVSKPGSFLLRAGKKKFLRVVVE